ncbi:MAG: GNAT family N-acetyltransferase [Clostridiales bacterium]|nr:GNAT family N-acetyltransferase [Clostridiales bacterium]
MTIRRFDLEEDLLKLEVYLREEYLANRNMTSWLPERLNDLIWRMDVQYTDAGLLRSSDFIYLWEDEGRIAGCILPDGDAVYISLDKDYEDLYGSMVRFAEENLLPLFSPDEDGTIDFLVINNDSLTSRKAYLEANGYSRQKEEDYDNFVYPQQADVSVDLPEGFRLAYGDEYTDEDNKWSACNMGFHPDLESPVYRNGMSAYNSRKNSTMYKDSFECLIIDENAEDPNDVCSYSFVYVDLPSKTAYIEPVSTRERYRHKGIGTAMMHGVIQRCRELGVEKCYVNSYDWRRKFYNAAGFITEDTIGFYHKALRRNS